MSRPDALPSGGSRVGLREYIEFVVWGSSVLDRFAIKLARVLSLNVWLSTFGETSEGRNTRTEVEFHYGISDWVDIGFGGGWLRGGFGL